MLLEDVQTGGLCGENLTWPSGASGAAPAPPKSLSIRGHWKVSTCLPRKKSWACVFLWSISDLCSRDESNLNSMWLSGRVLMHSMHTGCQRHPVKDFHWHYGTARSPVRDARRLPHTSCSTEIRPPDFFEKRCSFFLLHFKSSSSLTHNSTPITFWVLNAWGLKPPLVCTHKLAMLQARTTQIHSRTFCWEQNRLDESLLF